ncbi:MAG: hypothetical protein CL666_11040 [Balneola sp.]|nr:hypothetical protein [Balneola sp.]
MRLALLQPQFAPNLYDLSAMLKADLVVWNDLEQWHRKGRTHRATIKGEQGEQWINIPVMTEDRKKPIREVRIDQEEEWIEPFWNALHHNYSEATWYDFFAEELESDIQKFADFEKLINLNTWFFGRLMKYLEFNVDYKFASQIPEFEPNPDVFVENIKAGTLFQEHGSRHYQWRSDAAVDPIEKHPTYSQIGDDFLSELSLLDLLFNEGKESFRVFEKLT